MIDWDRIKELTGQKKGFNYFLADKLSKGVSALSLMLSRGIKHSFEDTVSQLVEALQLDAAGTIELMRANMVTIKRNELKAAREHGDTEPTATVEHAAKDNTLKAFMEKRYDALKEVHLRPDIGYKWLSDTLGIANGMIDYGYKKGFPEEHLEPICEALMLDDPFLAKKLDDGGREGFLALNAQTRAQAKGKGGAAIG